MLESVDSTGATGRTIGRRRVLSAAFGGLAFSTMLVLDGSRAQAAPVSITVRLLPGPGSMFVPVAEGRVFEAPRRLGGKLRVEGATLRRGSVLVVAWDDRMYTAEGPVLLQGNRRLPVQELGGPALRGDGRMALALKIDEDLPPGVEYSLRLGRGRPNQYPQDIITAPLPTTIEVQGPQQGAAVAVIEAPSSTQQSQVWGAALGASWVPIEWANGYRSWRPELITIRSVGPDAVPPGTILSVQLEQRLFRNPSLLDLAGNVMQTTALATGGIVGLSWALPSSLEVGKRVSLQLNSDILKPHGELTAFQAPTVSVQSTNASPGQRVTGQESTTRLDSATTKATRVLFPLDQHPPAT